MPDSDSPLPPVEWTISDRRVPYPDALAAMEERVAAIHAGTAREQVWLLEHPSLYTAGTSARESDLLTPERFPVYRSGRGGQYTYHGPGQRVAYVMLDLRRQGRDIRCFVHDLEEWVLQALATFNVHAERRDGRVGLWVPRKNASSDGRPWGGGPLGAGQEDKIAAIGVRVRKWVSFHGVAINLDPDLSHFEGIVPCGIRQHGVTSLVDLGLPVTMADLDVALRVAFEEVFHRPSVGAAPARSARQGMTTASVTPGAAVRPG
jgi:lipoyl(octanoyl) transferase